VHELVLARHTSFPVWRRATLQLKINGSQGAAESTLPCLLIVHRRLNLSKEATYRTRTVIMSLEKITTISPITNKPVITRNGLSDADLQLLPETAATAFESYRRMPLAERQAIVKKAMKLLNERQDVLGKEITEQMGRPIAYTAKEVSTAVMRGEYLLKISDEVLKDTDGEPEKGFKRYIRKVPLGPVLILFPWNVGVAQDYIYFIDADHSCSIHI
jgi:acyl-CoA reductase-like NAD-dependent aldehyde dehydrogenase